ncbi:MAG: zinc ribbon domain-containing protein [Acidimicrobiales bacterium]
MPTDTPGLLERLLETQDLDLGLDRLAYRLRELDERRKVRQLEAALAGVEATLGRTESERAGLAKSQEEKEVQISAITARVGAIEARLRSGSAGSFRDQQAMADEIASLGRQKRQVEDAEISLMEQIEPLDAELAAAAPEQARLSAELDGARASLFAVEAEIERERSALLARRQEVAAELSEGLRADYERLRAKLGGIGAARLVNGSCGGCHLKLPASERDRIARAPSGTVVHCEQCGRILVP